MLRPGLYLFGMPAWRASQLDPDGLIFRDAKNDTRAAHQTRRFAARALRGSTATFCNHRYAGLHSGCAIRSVARSRPWVQRSQKWPPTIISTESGEVCTEYFEERE